MRSQTTVHAASAATIMLWTRSTESHLTILGTLSPSTQQPCKGERHDHRHSKHTDLSAGQRDCDSGLCHVPFRMCGCDASFKPVGPTVCQQSRTIPVKPRQSGRTILMRSAKQYKSFHMPTLNTSESEAGCCCDDACCQAHY